MESDRVDLLIVAGEASGDLHGARLLAELRPRVPGLAPFGLGGEELAAAGLDRVADSGEISVVGLTEVLKVLPRAREIFDLLLAEVDRRRPRLAVLIDFPEFNLRLAKALKERGVPVVYYISPQVWAWRRGRVKTIAELVDAMLVLFPFETEFYRRYGVDVVHVGHPLVDEIPELPHVWDRGEPAGEPYQIALLPGSRVSEVEALLPVMLETVRLLAAEIPLFARLIRASTVPRAMLEEAVALSGLPVRIVPAAERFEAVASSHFALCASGTATLEVGLLGTPMAVLYRLGSWTYLLGRLLVRLPYVSLVNLVLGREAVPELLQARAHPERVRDVALSVLRDPAAVAAVRSDLAELRGRLGERGASARAAREVAARLPAEVPA
ncbi:MAG TPA: lipid-A-disaccharide synthase [Thermoanaerobaculia bacterium]